MDSPLFTAPERPRRRVSLTPMIDVVFLLLIFFMLAARFGMDQAIPLRAGGSGDGYSGPPRLVELQAEGVLLNGIATPDAALPSALGDLVETPTDTIVLSAGEADTQRLADIITLLERNGFTAIALTD